MKKFVICMILIVISFNFFAFRSYALTDVEYVFLKTYESVTNLKIADIPSTASGISYYDYAKKNGVNFDSLAIPNSENWVDSLRDNIIDADKTVLDFVARDALMSPSAMFEGQLFECTGVNADAFYNSLWDNLLNNNGYNGNYKDHSPVYDVSWGSGGISIQYLGYATPNQNWQTFGTVGLPSPFLGYAAGGGYGSSYYKFIPTGGAPDSIDRYSVVVGSSSGVSVYAESGIVFRGQAITGISVEDSSNINAFGDHFVRVSVTLSTNGGYDRGCYFDVKTSGPVSSTSTDINYSGIDTNLIGYWRKKTGSGDSSSDYTWQPITPSEIIVHGWELKPNGFITVDGVDYPVYVDFSSQPVINAAVDFVSNYPIVFDNPYMYQYDLPYTDVIDIIKDSSKQRDTYLKKFTDLLYKISNNKCECPEWLAQILEILQHIHDFLTAVPDYVQYSTGFFTDVAERSKDYIESYGYTPP